LKVIRFLWRQATRYGILDGNDVLALKGDILGDFQKGEALCQLKDIKLLAPVKPNIIVGLGGNYHSLLKLDTSIHAKPEAFLKPPSAVIGHLDDIICPQNADSVNMEGELAVIIKREAKHVPEGEGKDYILGYTCANDVTALISEDKVDTRAKGYYTFCPIGPCIETDLDPQKLKITSRVNGKLIQDKDPTSNMVYDVNKIITYITEFMALQPLDIILTGTSRMASQIKPGDTVEVEISEIGVLRNYVVG
jgi:2-keto-4-pentenoate hydratase/2-oxohepta-3-ene-1,7-dioic acid hydratase in catechol pathway